jgi:iron(III) transport system permease protein
MAVVETTETLAESRVGQALRQPVLGGILLVLVVGLLTLTPVAFIVLGSLNVAKPGEHFTFGLDGWREALGGSARTLSAIGYTFLLSVRAPLAAICGFLIAWLLIRVRVPGHRLLEFGLWLAFFLPPLPVTMGWILLADPNYGLLNEAAKAIPFIGRRIFNIYSVGGILWVHLATTSIPIMTILLLPAFRQFNGSLEESALVSGASNRQVLRQITLPILAPTVLAALIAGFIRSLEAFEVEQLLGTPANIMVYSTRIYDYIHWEPAMFPPAMALSSLFLVILFGSAVFYQRYTASRHFATITGRGMGLQPATIGALRYLASGVCFFFLFVSVVVPLVMLVLGSFMLRFGFFAVAQPFTTLHWSRVFSDSVFIGSVFTSVKLGLLVATAGIILYALLAYTILRTRIWGRGIISVLVWLPWSLPGMLLGMGLLWLILSVPGINVLYGTIGGLALALVIKEMPLGVQMLKTAFGQIGNEMEEASFASGAGWLTTFRRILLPLAAPMLVNIYIWIFMGTLRDISTTVLLASPSARPLSILMLEFASGGNLEAAVVVGTIISALALVVAILFRRYGMGLAPQDG